LSTDRISRRHTLIHDEGYCAGPGHLSYEQSEIDTEQATVDSEVEPGTWQELYEIGRYRDYKKLY